MNPRGKLLIIGGAEDKGDEHTEPTSIRHKNKEFKLFEILGDLLPPEERVEHRIEVITTATLEPLEMSKIYIRAFERAGFSNIHHIGIDSKDEARNEEYLERIEKANAVLFSGGDQFRLATILGGTPVIELIHQRYREDEEFIVAGTSAGAMVMGPLMIYQGENYEALLKGEVRISSGFGLINNCIIDTHFVKRGRFGRLAQAIIMNPSCTGIGLGEDTALIIKNGNEAECRGSGMVIIIDGHDIGHTNISYTEDYTPLCVENLRVHILSRGNGFLLNEKTFIPARRTAIEEENAQQ
jgi:cyanophycinase